MHFVRCAPPTIRVGDLVGKKGNTYFFFFAVKLYLFGSRFLTFFFASFTPHLAEIKTKLRPYFPRKINPNIGKICTQHKEVIIIARIQLRPKTPTHIIFKKKGGGGTVILCPKLYNLCLFFTKISCYLVFLASLLLKTYYFKKKILKKFESFQGGGGNQAFLFLLF